MLRQASREAAAKAKEAAAVGKKSGLNPSRTRSQTEVERAVAEKAVEEAKKEDAEKGMDEKEKDEVAEEKLKSAQRRASVVAMGEMQRPGLEGTAVESTADIRVDDFDVKGKETGVERSGTVSATMAGEKEEVARDLRETAKEQQEEREEKE